MYKSAAQLYSVIIEWLQEQSELLVMILWAALFQRDRSRSSAKGARMCLCPKRYFGDSARGRDRAMQVPLCKWVGWTLSVISFPFCLVQLSSVVFLPALAVWLLPHMSGWHPPI